MRIQQPLIWHKRFKRIYKVVTINFHPAGHEHVRYYPDYFADPEDIQEAWFDDVEFMYPTGLKDKNGKEVYESDICSGHRAEEDVLYEILWMPHCAKFGAKVIKTNYVLSKDMSFPLQHYIKDGTMECVFEVIGNIYTHPELLEEEK